MHFFAAVVVPDVGEVEPIVQAALAPYDENERDDDGAFWDWWQIGGRWTGVWSDYNPATDPENVETCRLCGGSGLRPDWERFGAEWREQTGGCNGCGGKGADVKWPTSWRSHPGDVVTVDHLLDNPELQVPWTVVVPEGPIWHKEEWDGNDFVRFHADTDDEWATFVRKALEEYRGKRLVVVDYHS